MSEAVGDGVQTLHTTAGAQTEPRPWIIALPAALILALATALMLQRVEPFVNYYYITAWYPTLLIVDAAVAARSGRYYLLTRPRFALSLLAWSAVLWFVFELINFRVANWYYVFLPPQRAVRWIGTTVSFATVLPIVFLAERWLAERGAFVNTRWPGFQVTSRLRRAIVILGLLFVALSLAWPRYFFPMIWGALTLLLEPWNHRRDPGRSLMGDLSAGRPGRLLRLLLAGLAVGFLWELFNIEARSKWVYTVPGFENFKLFEMPLLGFGGFPVFALDCFVAYQTLVLLGVAVAPERAAAVRRFRPRRTLLAGVLAAAFCFGVLVGMDRWNTDSLRPELARLWIAGPAEREALAQAGYDDVFKLAETDPGRVATAAGVDRAEAEEWVRFARLTTLRGIGAGNARLLWDVGIRSVDELAAADPSRLSEVLRARAQAPRAATPPKVRVWVRAARQAVAADERG